MFTTEDIESSQRMSAEILAWNLEKYSKTCGVRAFSMIRGISNMDGALELYLIREPGGDYSYTTMMTLGIGLRRKVMSAALSEKENSLYERFPTLGQWIEHNRNRLALVRADHHFAVVAYGNILDKNWDNKRAKVTQVIFLDD